MSYDSNTKVSLLIEKFSRLFLITNVQLLLSHDNSAILSILENYRGVERGNKTDMVTDALVSANYLTELSQLRYDGKHFIFKTIGWYKDLNIVFIPRTRQVQYVTKEGKILTNVTIPGELHESIYYVYTLAEEIRRGSVSFLATPSKHGYSLKRYN